jgi:hypothetical protein
VQLTVGSRTVRLEDMGTGTDGKPRKVIEAEEYEVR